MGKSAFLVLVISLIFLFACEGKIPSERDITIKPDSVTSDFPDDDTVPKDLVIRLKRSPCKGECPAYMLTIYADGRVKYFGQDSTEVLGQKEDKISEEKVKQLVKVFEKAKYFDLKDEYINEDCTDDMNNVFTTLFINSKVKKIQHNLGCKAPQELNDLENKIDEIVGTKKWIGDSK